MPIGTVYCATNKINGKKYVGCTSRVFSKRMSRHLLLAARGEDGPFMSAIRKYGPDAFEWEILEQGDAEYLFDERETHYIRKLRTRCPDGYNLTDGGRGTLGYKHTAETKRRKSEAMTGKKMHLSEESVQKIRAAHVGKKVSPETRRKMSEAAKGRKASPETRRRISEGNKGKEVSPETRAKISAGHKGKKLSAEHKEKLSAAKMGKKRGPHSELHRKRISEALKNRNPS